MCLLILVKAQGATPSSQVASHTVCLPQAGGQAPRQLSALSVCPPTSSHVPTLLNY